ncbi:MAG: transcription-repair coupling factor [Chlamydiota bacterium]
MNIPSFDAFLEAFSKEPSLLIEGLWDCPKALLIDQIAKSTHKNVIVITGGERENRLFDDLLYFGTKNLLEFPSWDTLPGEEILPSADILGKRYEILFSLQEKKKNTILLCSLQAVLQKVVSKKVLPAQCQKWKKGDNISFATLPELLLAMGYRRSPTAADKGEFAVRGGILDIFPISSPDPFRIDFFGDTIDDIRIYDPTSQKSIRKIDSLFIAPAEEEKPASSLFDYLGEECIVIFDDLLAIEDKYVSLKKYFNIDALLDSIKNLKTLYWTKEPIEALSPTQITKKVGRDYYSKKNPLQPLSFEIFNKIIETSRFSHPFVPIIDYFGEDILRGLSTQAKTPLEVHFVSSSPAEETSFKERLKNEEVLLPKNTTFEHGYLSSGFVIPEENYALIPMTTFTQRFKTRREKWRSTYHTPASEFHELSIGDIVVHFQSGIGKYLGTEKRPNSSGIETEFMMIEYAEKSKLFVPIAQAHLVSRYIGANEEIPTFSTLGTTKWQRTRAKAEQSIVGYAHDLLKISAERVMRGGFAYPADSSEMIAFEEEFPFVETEDQLEAVKAIKQDMCTAKAMDRLICGDVGYGKTEVAMRAAFKAALDGKKQVAVLVPTTVLALQHYETFSARMANFPLNIGILSRFKTAKENKETLKKVASGAIDIVIGTHRIISNDVIFKDLGLIIIDEEQRFGVRAKEHLKKIKIGVDCLTLSATPIPRTLYMSLIGAREISVINTPPQDRLPIKTMIAGKENDLIKNALLRELTRDGQAYFIHNRVETIFQVSEELGKLLPEARIVTGHGQMAGDELDSVFHAFKSGNADILVATTIIENGVDIPNANTILIDRADRFGLADLYQMRGRVGRWNRPAYAYFLVPPNQRLPELTSKRLHALVEASGYGGGMKIAMRDLEIRGAGDILGTKQSGEISAVGFHLYCKLLKRAVSALRKEAPISFTETKMEFPYDASLPETYINESGLRMELYHRLGELTTSDEVDALLAEMRDRFGKPPQPVLFLYHLTRLRIFAMHHQFTLLKFGTYTLIAEQQKPKTTLKKTLPLPKTNNPATLEVEVTAALKAAFSLS